MSNTTRPTSRASARSDPTRLHDSVDEPDALLSKTRGTNAVAGPSGLKTITPITEDPTIGKTIQQKAEGVQPVDLTEA